MSRTISLHSKLQSTSKVRGQRRRSVRAFSRRAPEIAAVADAQLVAINVDVQQAVRTVLDALPAIRRMRPDLALLAHSACVAVDALGEYALATREADLRYAKVRSSRMRSARGNFVELTERALELRNILRSDAAALARRGLIDPERLAPFKGVVGYKNIASELAQYAALLFSVWPEIQGRTALTESELAHAKHVSLQLLRVPDKRAHIASIVDEAAHVRQQAFTLMFQAYSEVRRSLTFLRWHDKDVDSIAPSLYAGRGGRGKRTRTPETVASDP